MRIPGHPVGVPTTSGQLFRSIRSAEDRCRVGTYASRRSRLGYVATPRALACSSPGWVSFTSAKWASFGPALGKIQAS
ncbi:hypothetical protein D0Z66_20545 (plasmid) [Cereibacter sphaeroides]|nr:hypothetical protein D0Z66_20545 [Cereibacter sphaeroides]